MGRPLTRRDFLHCVAASGATFGLIGCRGNQQPAQPSGTPDIPPLDGSLVQDDTSLTAAGTDLGGVFTRRPWAVLRPGSTQDVLRMAEYANSHDLRVVMRGRGCSRYGQSLVERGIVIDSQTLSRVSEVAAGTIEVQAGASLENVARAALDAGFALPVITPCIMLSVGGFLSVGGQTRGTHRYGAFVDQVAELEVVTGDGQLVTCSDAREPELFEMILAGMGQCGIITRAKLRVIPAPEFAGTRILTYNSLEPFLRDQERLVSADAGFDHMTGHILPSDNQSWTYTISLTRLGTGASAIDLDLRGLSPQTVGDLTREPYRSYILPTPQPAPTAGQQRRVVGGPSLALWAPASCVRELLSGLLTSTNDTAGIVRMECTGYNTGQFHRPLFRLPDEKQWFAIWLLRTVYADSGPNLQTQLEANARFLDRALAMGAKRYPPYTGIPTPRDWNRHFGEGIYRRFAAAKRRYDPRNRLTPGAGIFA